MGSSKKVVLLACGSFNPITIMHLRMFEIARDYLHNMGICKVIGGIISPVHDLYGKKDLAPANHRNAMIEKALQNVDWIRLDTWEINQNNWTETRKVLAHHQEMYDTRLNANQPVPSKRMKAGAYNSHDIPDRGCQIEENDEPVQVKLLCGADVLESFAVPGLWKDCDINEIVGRYGLVVITRSCTDPQKFIYDSDVLFQHQRNIHIVKEWITNDVSSTKIRRAIKRGESIRYLVHDEVLQYIDANRLYNADSVPVSGLHKVVILTPSPNNNDVILPGNSQHVTKPLTKLHQRPSRLQVQKSNITCRIPCLRLQRFDDLRSKTGFCKQNPNPPSPETYV